MAFIDKSVSFYNLIEKHKEGLKEGSGKLCISPCLLSSVNEALDCLKSDGKSTPVDIPYEVRIALFDLDNVFKVSTKLKLIQRNVATYSGISSLKRFTSLKQIEFFRVSFDNVEGIDANNVVDCVSCSRCSEVFNLFVTDIWSNLTTLSLSYCQLNRIQAKCLSNLNSVTHLNLIFNNLKTVEGLDTLTNLVSLNISYNCFEEIPDFGSNSSLTELYMSHNNITTFEGLSKLVNLTHFDASDNCIYVKEILVDLYCLKHLHWLKLSNNPLCLRKHYRMYVSHFLGTIQPPYKFLLDEVPLTETECDFFGSSRGVAPKYSTVRRHIMSPSLSTTPLLQTVAETNSEVILETKGILKSANRKVKKGREVIIVDSSGDPSKTPAVFTKSRKTGIVMKDSVSLDSSEPSNSGDQPSCSNLEASVGKPAASESRQDSALSESSEININKNDQAIQNQMMKQNGLLNDKALKQPFHIELHSSPESTKAECRTVEVTVHATQDEYRLNSVDAPRSEAQTPQDELNELKTIDIDDIRLLESIDIILQKTGNDNSNVDNTEDLLEVTTDSVPQQVQPCENITQDNINNNEASYHADTEISENKSSSDDSASEDELTSNENLWPVQKIVDSKSINMFLVLLDTELRERSTISGRTIASYPLVFCAGCTQVKEDPITIELIFSSLLKRTDVQTYVMEFADAQTLMKKINVFLASRPDEVEDQLSSFVCKSCNALFSVYKTRGRTLCAVCGSALVMEMEKPPVEIVKEPLSNSSSQSSIVSSLHGAPENKTSFNNDTNLSTVSSGDMSEKSDIVNSLFTSTPIQRNESDVEIISNPSQSSIEVLDERDTPSRKRSSEERHVMITPLLPTVEEVSDSQLSSISETIKPFSFNDQDCIDASSLQTRVVQVSGSVPPVQSLQNTSDDKSAIQVLTESSSSGSVMTSYETSGTVAESNLLSDYKDIPETSVEADEAYDTCGEENDNTSLVDAVNPESNSDIYSYTNFSEVDHRIKAFLYQYVFHDDTEELALLVRCHIWKTGGTDYPACFILSNEKIYVFMHTSSVYGLDASDWLKLQESIDLKSMKKVFPLVWNLGVGLLINRLNYFILLQNKTYSDNLLAAFKGLSLKGCDFGSKASSKVELNLQQVVLTSNYVCNVIDPTILLYTVCPSINILKDDELEETMKLGGFVMTAHEFYIVLGDFSWLAGSNELPSIHFFHLMSHLIEVEQKDNVVSLHFLDSTEALEVVWQLHCSNRGQVIAIIDSMRAPWENVFAQPLQVSCK